MKLVINVTQEDIDNGLPCREQRCPIALAAGRSLGIEPGSETYVHAGIDYVFVCQSCDEWVLRKWPTTHIMRVWMATFDMCREDVKPAAFELEEA